MYHIPHDFLFLLDTSCFTNKSEISIELAEGLHDTHLPKCTSTKYHKTDPDMSSPQPSPVPIQPDGITLPRFPRYILSLTHVLLTRTENVRVVPLNFLSSKILPILSQSGQRSSPSYWPQTFDNTSSGNTSKNYYPARSGHDLT